MATSHRYTKSLRTAPTIVLLITWLTTPILGGGCDLDTCNSACLGFEVANSYCHNDYQPWDNLVSCLCQDPYHAISSGSYAAGLDQCVVCNLPDVGPSQLSFYQSWDVICTYYAQAGEQAALNAAQDSVNDVVQAFSLSRLPALRSAFCGEAVVSTSSTSSSTTSSLTMSSSGSAVTSSSLSSMAGSSLSTSTSEAVTSSAPSSSSMVSTSAAITTSSSGSFSSASSTPNSGSKTMSSALLAMRTGTSNIVLIAVSIGIGGLMLAL